MNVVEATQKYEIWAKARCGLVAADIERKHKLMAQSAFSFLRATFYRWAALWQDECPELAHTPKILAVGDIHVENFGTWRDSEGRLVWGVNDFDEAYPIAYANDLVRLAASALLAIAERQLSIGPEEACGQILDGYRQAIAAGNGTPFVLEESHPTLRAAAMGVAHDPVRFWGKMSALESVRPPAAARTLLLHLLPKPHTQVRFMHRVVGTGGLGRPRYLALALCDGGFAAREAKAILPSAFGWAAKARGEKVYCAALAARAIRATDPFFVVTKGWAISRIGPDCSRIELADLPQARDEAYLLHAMGREIANVHSGTPGTMGLIARDLKQRGPHWVLDAAKDMRDATMRDWKAWRSDGP